MELFLRGLPGAKTLAIFPGTFNPPTRAHLALARTSLARADEVLFVLPRAFPHKPYEGASFNQRVEMLRTIAESEPRFSIGASDRGLFIDIARECRDVYHDVRLLFLCGRDAAERIVNWPYEDPNGIAHQLEEFELLVAARRGMYSAPPNLSHRIHTLDLETDYGEISASEVRQRIRKNEDWWDLVPKEIAHIVERIYR